MEQDVDNAGNYVGDKVEDGVQDVADFPDDAARWAGRKVTFYLPKEAPKSSRKH